MILTNLDNSSVPPSPPPTGPSFFPPNVPSTSPPVTAPPAPKVSVTRSSGHEYMFDLLLDKNVSEITINGWQSVFSVREGLRSKENQNMFHSAEDYVFWLEQLLKEYTIHDHASYREAAKVTEVLEAPLRAGKLMGTVHVVMPALTLAEPVVTIRKQSYAHMTLRQMEHNQSMSIEMREFLEAAVRGRLNIMVMGGSGAGKTTLVRAFSDHVAAEERIVTCEEVQELSLRLANTVALFTHVQKDPRGKSLWSTSVDDLCRHALRMRPDRVWVGEIRGTEAVGWVKAATTGHAGSVTTVHAATARTGLVNMASYLMEGMPHVGLDAAYARVVRGVDIVVVVEKIKMSRHVVTEIVEVRSVVEKGVSARLGDMFVYDSRSDLFVTKESPSNELLRQMRRHGVNYSPPAAGYSQHMFR